MHWREDGIPCLCVNLSAWFGWAEFEGKLRIAGGRLVVASEAMPQPHGPE